MVLFNLWTEFENVMKGFQSWIFKNYSNPVLWLGMFLIGIAVFGIVYHALQKEK